MKRIPLSFLAILLAYCFISAILAGCEKDEDESSPTGISLKTGKVEGVITLPSSANDKTLWVVIDKDTDGDNGREGIAQCVCSYSLKYAYNFSNYPVGIYYIYAGVFLGSDDSGPPESGDYFGFYGSELDPPPFANVIITDNGTKTCDFKLYVVD